MTLGKLIERLRGEDSKVVVRRGFSGPHSYRGYYECLAFEPKANVTVGEMLKLAEGSLGKTFCGYKGGDFTMYDHTEVYLAEYGDCGQELGEATLDAMLEGDRKVADLEAKLAEADAARRYAQAVSSELVQEKRALRDILETIKGELVDRYAGAPDSTTRWMGSLIRDIEIAEALDAASEVPKSVPQEFRATEIDTPSETILSVTEWANTSFGQATIRTQIERAKKEFDELLDLLVVSGGLRIDEKVAEEAADVCICLYRVIGTLDPEAINKKMAKNRARKWKVDGNGTAQHVGE